MSETVCLFAPFGFGIECSFRTVIARSEATTQSHKQPECAIDFFSRRGAESAEIFRLFMIQRT